MLVVRRKGVLGYVFLTVICFRCKEECRDFEFDKELRPICSVCSGRRKIMEAVVSVHEERLERAWNGKDYTLSRWFR